MAGTFPDVPGHRFMYDQDGTLVLRSPNNAALPLTPFDALVLNDEGESDSASISSWAWCYFTFVFPEVRDISGVWVHLNNTVSTLTMEFSLDTTDGSDGTWQEHGEINESTVWNPNFRTDIQPTVISAVKGVRFRFNQQSNSGRILYAMHLYGSVPVTSSTERLEFWQPDADSILDKAGLDFGDMPLGSTRTKTFRVKNLSSSAAAEQVVVSANNLSGGIQNDPMVTGMEFSLDGSSWSPSVTVDSIAPQGVSPAVSVRRTVLLSEDITPRVARVVATPGVFA